MLKLRPLLWPTIIMLPIFLFFCIYWWGAGNAPIALH